MISFEIGLLIVSFVAVLHVTDRTSPRSSWPNFAFLSSTLVVVTVAAGIPAPSMLEFVCKVYKFRRFEVARWRKDDIALVYKQVSRSKRFRVKRFRDKRFRIKRFRVKRFRIKRFRVKRFRVKRLVGLRG